MPTSCRRRPLVEIMVGIAKGDAQHFEKNREPLRILYPTHKKTFLRMPGHFVLETLLGYRKKKIQVRVALSARSKSALGRNATRLLPASLSRVFGLWQEQRSMTSSDMHQTGSTASSFTISAI